MKQYSEALEILSEEFICSTSEEILDIKKELNKLLEEQNEMILSKKKKKNNIHKTL